MIVSCRVSSGWTGSLRTRRRWPGTWSRRAACSRSWPRTGPGCSRDADYADLFAPPGLGRPSMPATQMAAVLALQTLHDYSDRETAEAVRFDVRWKVAIGLAIDDQGSTPRLAGVLAEPDREVGAAAPG